MKTLTLIRHAKSSWSDPSLRDFDRPLNKRGHRNAPFMGQLLHAGGVHFDRIFSSPARRAMDTARYICAEIGYDMEELEAVPDLYHADAEDLLEFIRSTDDTYASIAVVGHNPALTELTNLLAPAPVDNVPTAGVVRFTLDAEHWREVGAGKSVGYDFDYPKKHR